VFGLASLSDPGKIIVDDEVAAMIPGWVVVHSEPGKGNRRFAESITLV
jgi:hypothetical protein